MTSRRRLGFASATVVLVLGLAAAASHHATLSGQGYTPSTKNGDWTHYTADVHGTRYSPLDQINGSNFKDLEVAWRFKTDNLGTRPEYKLEGTPLAIRGTLYTTAGTRR
jgi:quinoprotein glucose dehydrogenase